MRGRIIHYNCNDGNGLLFAENKQYPFEIAQWQIGTAPTLNAVVDFDSDGERVTAVRGVSNEILTRGKTESEPPADFVQEEWAKRKVQNQVSALETASLVRSGWRILFWGWVILPIIPIIGMIGLYLAAVVAFIISVIVLFKGNTRSGLILLLSAWLGSVLVSFIWAAIYLRVGILLSQS